MLAMWIALIACGYAFVIGLTFELGAFLGALGEDIEVRAVMAFVWPLASVALILALVVSGGMRPKAVARHRKPHRFA